MPVNRAMFPSSNPTRISPRTVGFWRRSKIPAAIFPNSKIMASQRKRRGFGTWWGSSWMKVFV